MNNLRCPRCGLSHSKKNGHTHYSKQNHQCLECGRQFVADRAAYNSSDQRTGQETALGADSTTRHLPHAFSQPGVVVAVHRRSL